jgi:hypothetical protein
MAWAVHEYGLFCEGSYTGFEQGLKRDADLARWLYDVIPPAAPDDLLAGGNVITNIVGMAHALGRSPLNLHDFFHNEQITLSREPGNVHDPDAVAVMHPRRGRLGYISVPVGLAGADPRSRHGRRSQNIRETLSSGGDGQYSISDFEGGRFRRRKGRQ